MENHDIHSKPLKTIRILLLEDNPVSRALMQENLRFLGAHVQACGSAAEACRVLEGAAFHCVLTDLHLPDAHATDLPGMLRRDHQGRPLIALTGAVRSKDRQAMVEHGFSACLAKPVDLQTLVDTILSFCPRS